MEKFSSLSEMERCIKAHPIEWTLAYENKVYDLYSDEGSTVLIPPEGDTYFFKTWNEMAEAPIYDGKKLKDIFQDIEVYA